MQHNADKKMLIVSFVQTCGLYLKYQNIWNGMKKWKDKHSPFTYSSVYPLFTTPLMASYFSLSHTHTHTHTHTHATVMWFVCCNNRFLMDTLTLKPLNPRLAQWPSKAPGLLASSVCQWFCHKCLFVSEWNVSTRLWVLFWVELFFLSSGIMVDLVFHVLQVMNSCAVVSFDSWAESVLTSLFSSVCKQIW